jgi:hypothetical protein
MKIQVVELPKLHEVVGITERDHVFPKLQEFVLAKRLDHPVYVPGVRPTVSARSSCVMGSWK